jgi:hypothetical protein
MMKFVRCVGATIDGFGVAHSQHNAVDLPHVIALGFTEAPE